VEGVQVSVLPVRVSAKWAPLVQAALIKSAHMTAGVMVTVL